nr:MAG TPA: hypothetical protein [Caudoviricetes sp.]
MCISSVQLNRQPSVSSREWHGSKARPQLSIQLCGRIVNVLTGYKSYLVE